MEKAGSNSRCLYAGINIAAPVSAVWQALTDYDALDNFIPGASLPLLNQPGSCYEQSDHPDTL